MSNLGGTNRKWVGSFFIFAFLSWTVILAAQEWKHRWASFRVGSWVELETMANDGSSSGTHTKWTLIEIRPEAAIVHLEVRRGGSIVTSQDVPFSVPEAKNTADRIVKDTLSFKGRELHCERHEYDEKKATIWECPEVPGFVGMSKSPKTTTTLVDFEAK